MSRRCKKCLPPKPGDEIDTSPGQLISLAVSEATNKQYASRLRRICEFGMETGLLTIEGVTWKQELALRTARMTSEEIALSITKECFIAFMNHHLKRDQIDSMTAFAGALRHFQLVGGGGWMNEDDPVVQKAISGFNFQKKKQMEEATPQRKRATIDSGDFETFLERLREKIPVSSRLKFPRLLTAARVLFEGRLRQCQLIGLTSPALKYKEGKPFISIKDKRFRADRTSFSMMVGIGDPWR